MMPSVYFPKILNCRMKFRKHSNKCLLTAAFSDRSIARRSQLGKPADIGAKANVYKSIRCKIINLTSDEAICIEARRY